MSALMHQFPRMDGIAYPRHYRVEDGFAPPALEVPVTPGAGAAHWTRVAPVAAPAGGDIASYHPGGAWAKARLMEAPPSPPRRDPSPSRLAYKLNRLWLTPLFRGGVKFGLPVMVLAFAVAAFLSDAERRAGLVTMASDLRQQFENRPEFMVNQITVHSDSSELAQGIVARLGLEFPVSSFRLDMDALRARVEAFDAVESASVRIRSGGVLEISAEERDPAMIWRNATGLELLDTEGRRVARLMDRAARPDLPIIAGEGAPDAIAEAWTLLQAARPLGPQLRGLVRIGERRWDVLLENDQRILLPATGAVPALERVLALNSAFDLLARDITHVDMRNPVRPTLRLSPEAAVELARIRSLQTGALSQ
jgi:cell division protein FtsQ